jgi:hypothetical protein
VYHFAFLRGEKREEKGCFLDVNKHSRQKIMLLVVIEGAVSESMSVSRLRTRYLAFIPHSPFPVASGGERNGI